MQDTIRPRDTLASCVDPRRNGGFSAVLGSFYRRHFTSLRHQLDRSLKERFMPVFPWRSRRARSAEKLVQIPDRLMQAGFG
jgi:hypothetical protein